MKKWLVCLTLPLLTTYLSADSSNCSECQCTMESTCDCMSMPECINQEGTCTPEAHCGCHNSPSCNCEQCKTCTITSEGCCAPKADQ